MQRAVMAYGLTSNRMLGKPSVTVPAKGGMKIGGSCSNGDEVARSDNFANLAVLLVNCAQLGGRRGLKIPTGPQSTPRL